MEWHFWYAGEKNKCESKIDIFQMSKPWEESYKLISIKSNTKGN